MTRSSLARLVILISICLSGCDKDDPGSCTPDKITLSVTNVSGPSACHKQDVAFTIVATGGTEPYKYEVNTGQTLLSQGSPNYAGLFPGKVMITVRDKFSCSATLEWDTTISGASPVSYKNEIIPIMDANCTKGGCHDGALGADRDWRTVGAIQKKLNHFQRILTLQKMPPPPNRLLTSEELNKVLCWIAYGAPDN